MKTDLLQPNNQNTRKLRSQSGRQDVVYRTKSEHANSSDTPHCACGGSCPKCQSQEETVQAKLNISKPHDPLEQEADRIADHIVDNKLALNNRKPNGISIAPKLQRKADSHSAPSAIPASVSKTLSGSGQSLSKDTRSQMETHLHSDFSHVRIHTGENATKSSREINAKAYTFGNDIVFNKNFYSPGTKEGDRLIAHELTHVVQQADGVNRTILQRDVIDTPIVLDEEPDEDEGEEAETEDEAEDGDNEVSDVVQYPELPDLPDQIEDDPLPVPIGPEGDDLASPDLAALNTDAVEMKGKGNAKIKAKKIKSILVDQPTQKMTITFTDGSTKGHNVSTGRGQCGTKGDPCKSQNSHNCTPNGTFTIVSQGNAKTKNSHGDAMAWFVGLNVTGRSGIGIHNSQPVPGIPHSHGCVRTGNAAQDGGVAEMINKGVSYGKTKVTIQGKAATTPYPCPKKKKKKKK
jgi:hypothetical protein